MKLKSVTKNFFRPAAMVLAVLSLFLIPIHAESEAACQGPGAFWPLDEAASPFVDLVASLQATCSGSAPTACPTLSDTDFIIGQAQLFSPAGQTGLNIAADGSGTSVFDWAQTDSFTIVAWVKPDAVISGTQVAVGRLHEDASTSLRLWLGVSPSGYANAQIADRDGVSDILLDSRATPLDLKDAWHLVGLVRDASTNQILLYVDGELADTRSVSYTAGFSSTTSPLNIGYLNTNSGSKFHFTGRIDEVAVYSSALTQANIKSQYDNGLLGQNYCADVAPSVLTTPAMNKAFVGIPYDGNFMASGNPAPTIALGANPPTGMTITDPATGQIDWLPLDNQYPAVNVEVTAQNSVGTDTKTVPIDIYDLCSDFMTSHWPLDEAASPYVDDVAALAATCSGTAPTACPTLSDTDFILGQAQLFSPTGGTGLDIAADGSQTSVFDWAQTDSFTIEAWVKPDAVISGTQVAVGRLHEDASTSLRLWLGVSPSGYANAQIADRDGVSDILLDSRATPLDLKDGWHLIGLVRDASMNQIRLFVDGELADTQSVTYTSGFSSATSPLNIGYLNTNSGSKFHFTGRIDGVALYNEALTAPVFDTHYQNGLIGKGYCNAAPMFIASSPDPAPTTATEGQLYTVDFNATDSDPDTLTWSLVSAPAGMQIDANGVVTWTPPDATTPVSYEVMVQDGQGGTSTQTFSIDVTAAAGGGGGGGTTPPASSGGGGGGGGCFIDSIR